MRDVRVAVAQISPKLGQLDANIRIHRDWIARARRKRAQVVVFPELSLTGYLLRDQVPEVAVRIRSAEFREIAALSLQVDLVVGFVEETAGHLYHNTAAYLSKGRVVHLHRKVHLPTYGMFDEGRDFARGDQVRRFDSPFGPAGILVCEDAWHPANAWLLAHQGSEILYVPANGPARGARPKKGVTSVGVWRDLLRVTAQFQTAFAVFANRVGYEDGLAFGGGSTIVDPFGKVILSLPPLEEGLEVAELAGEVLRRARTAYPLLRDEDLELVHREIARIRTLRYDLPPEPAERKAGPRIRRNERATP